MPKQTTVTQYKNNLQYFVTDARQNGITPVLVTPLDSASGAWSTNAGLDEYAAAMRVVATDFGVPLVDLYAISKAHNLSIGRVAAAALYTDGIHLNASGSAVFGQEVAQELAKVVPSLQPYLNY